MQPNQRTSAGLKRAACALAVFVPFEVAVGLLSLLVGVVVSSGSVWNWVQGAGQEAMRHLEEQLEALEKGMVPHQLKCNHYPETVSRSPE